MMGGRIIFIRKRMGIIVLVFGFVYLYLFFLLSIAVLIGTLFFSRFLFLHTTYEVIRTFNTSE